MPSSRRMADTGDLTQAEKKAFVLECARRWALEFRRQGKEMAPHMAVLAGLLAERQPAYAGYQVVVAESTLKAWYYEDAEWATALNYIWQAARGRLIQKAYDEALTERGHLDRRMWAVRIDPEMSEKSIEERMKVVHEVKALPFVPGGLKALPQTNGKPEAIEGEVVRVDSTDHDAE